MMQMYCPKLDINTNFEHNMQPIYPANVKIQAKSHRYATSIFIFCLAIDTLGNVQLGVHALLHTLHTT
jgi:hypothetical protein